MHAFGILLALALEGGRSAQPPSDDLESLRREAYLRREHHRQVAIRLNDLAGNIRSEADARALVDEIAKFFADSLPPASLTGSIRQRVSHAEFEAVTDIRKRISDQRIADVWNEYVRRIGAPEEAQVTPTEIHNLRDGLYAAGRYAWESGDNEQ